MDTPSTEWKEREGPRGAGRASRSGALAVANPSRSSRADSFPPVHPGRPTIVGSREAPDAAVPTTGVTVPQKGMRKAEPILNLSIKPSSAKSQFGRDSQPGSSAQTAETLMAGAPS